MERRFIQVEIRAADGESGELIVEGYPIVYEQEANLGIFREKIAKGAAKEALKRSNEFVLFNHDSNIPLARRTNGTLEAKEDDKGVFIRADLSKSSRGPGVYEDIKNGLIDKMSFAFTVERDSWEDDLRTVEEFSEIFDYSPVTYPAYTDTELVARSTALAVRSKPQPEASGKAGTAVLEVMRDARANLQSLREGGENDETED